MGDAPRRVWVRAKREDLRVAAKEGVDGLEGFELQTGEDADVWVVVVEGADDFNELRVNAWFTSVNNKKSKLLFARNLDGLPTPPKSVRVVTFTDPESLTEAVRRALVDPPQAPEPPVCIAMLADRPLEAGQKDLLGHEVYAKALAALIDNPETATPFVLAVNGPWGAGKSSVAGMVRRELEGKPADGGSQPHVTAWFDAWMHDDATSLVTSLATFVAREAARRRPWWRRVLQPLPAGLRPAGDREWYRVARASLFVVLAAILIWQAPAAVIAIITGEKPEVWETILKMGGWGVIAALISVGAKLLEMGQAVEAFVMGPDREAATASVGRVREQLGTLVEQALPPATRFVLFVDDLDRCRPPKGVDVLEAVNQLLDHERVVVVLVADMPALAAAVDLKYKDMAERYDPLSSGRPAKGAANYGRVYLQKIVQLQFDLPLVERTRLATMVGALAAGDVPESAPPVRQAGEVVSTGTVSATPVPVPWPRHVDIFDLAAGLFALVGALVLMATVAFHLDAFASAFEFLSKDDAWWKPIVRLFPIPLIGVVATVLSNARQAWNDRQVRLARAAIASGNAPTTLGARVADYGPRLVKEHEDKRLLNESDLFKRARDEASKHLPVQPRHAKRLLNRIRLLIYIAHHREMLEGASALDARQIGRWAVLQERWPELAQVVVRRPEVMGLLEKCAPNDADYEKRIKPLCPSAAGDEDLKLLLSDEVELGPVMRRLVHFERGPEPTSEGASTKNMH